MISRRGLFALIGLGAVEVAAKNLRCHKEIAEFNPYEPAMESPMDAYLVARSISLKDWEGALPPSESILEQWEKYKKERGL